MDESSPDTPAKLRINRNAPVGAGPIIPCPHCGADIPKDAVICVACGVDLRTGKKLKTSRIIKPRKAALLAGGILLLLLLVTLIVLLFNGDHDIEDTPALATDDPASTAPAHEPGRDQQNESISSEPPPDLAESAVPEAEEELTEEQTAPAASDTEQEDDPASETGQENDPDSAIERERVESMRTTLREALDERAPPYAIGDEVELRMQTGLVYRGTLISVRQGVALIVDEDIRERVPIDGLDRASRLRIDPEIRERLVESRLRQLLNSEEER